MTLIDRIETAMMKDDSDREKNSERLIELYEQADTEGRAILDDALMHLCGWWMPSLIAAEEAHVKNDKGKAANDAVDTATPVAPERDESHALSPRPWGWHRSQ